jgi:ribosome-associated heat shock protein Hsp15
MSDETNDNKPDCIVPCGQKFIFSAPNQFEPTNCHFPMEKVRIDKWLWSVRVFKSRTIAADEIKSGKVRIGDHVAKPSDNVQVGQVVQVKKDGFNFEFFVKALIDKRVAAPIAMECYENRTPEAELNKYKEWYVGKQGTEQRERGTGRPTKRERREIDDFKGDRFEMNW